MKKVCIIAEAGVNHNGRIDLAKEMIRVAKEAGVDYVKFQTFRPQNLVSKFAEKAEYQKKSTGSGESQLEMLKKLTLSDEDYVSLKSYCDEQQIGFISTPFDLDSIAFLEQLNMDFWKIPSGEITNLPYLEAIGRTGKKVVLSTGMSEISEVQEAISVLEKNGTKEIILLHCNTQYPTPFQDVELLAMTDLKKKTGKRVGYSDHSLGIEVPIAAAALGAEIIEKHFTLDRTMEGPDHLASLEPEDLKNMVKAIRNIEQALGNGIKKVSPSEMENKNVARKSIVAKCKIQKGEIFTEENLTTKRPGNGISPMKWHEALGKKAIKDFQEDELIVL
jgi:N-acetylneuraminate synthase